MDLKNAKFNGLHCVCTLMYPSLYRAGRTWKRSFLGKDDSCDRSLAI